MNINVRPLRGKVFVQKISSVSIKQESPIIVPEGDNKCVKGIVLAVGLGKITNSSETPLEVQEGDTVIFNTYAGTNTGNIFEKKDVFLINEEDILAIIN